MSDITEVIVCYGHGIQPAVHVSDDEDEASYSPAFMHPTEPTAENGS